MFNRLTLIVSQLAALALLGLASTSSAAAAVDGERHATPEERVIRVVGTSLEIVDADGRHRSGQALAGVELVMGDAGGAPRLRIQSVVNDGARGVTLHEVESLDASGTWNNVCEPDRDGRRLALFVEGYDLPDGRQVREPGRVSMTCTAGVQGKCLRAGYFPWDDSRGPGTGVELYQTCTRMFRADYCGNGVGWTRNGMAIDLFDVHAIQKPEEPATLPFEAAWGPAGALCVHHTRVPDRIGLKELIAQCPRLATARNGEACTEGAARSLPGVLLFNRSAQGAVSPTRFEPSTSAAP